MSASIGRHTGGLVALCALSLALAPVPPVHGQSPSPEAQTNGHPVDIPAGVWLHGSEPVEAEVSAPDEEDSYWFDGTADDFVQLGVTALDRDLDPVLEVYGPGREWMATVDDSLGLDAAIGLTLDTTGAYLVVVRSAGYGSTGPYRLDVGISSAARLQVGAGPIQGSLQGSGMTDTYRIDLADGERVGIELRSGDFDAHLSIFAPEGALYGENDDSDGTDSRLEVVAPTAGTYRIEARSLDRTSVGDYTIEALADVVVTLVDWESQFGRSQSGVTEMPYAIDGMSGQGRQVTVTSTEFLPAVTVSGPDRLFVTSATGGYDDATGGWSARLVVMPQLEGRYRIDVLSGDGNHGSFEIRSEPLSGEWLTPGYVEGWLGVGEEDRYLYDGYQDENVWITMGSGELDSYLRIVGPDGAEIVSDDDSGGGDNGLDAYVSAWLPSDGIFEIVAATAGGGSEGAYWLSLESDR